MSLKSMNIPGENKYWNSPEAVFGLIFLLGAFLRFYNISFLSFWKDEPWEVQIVQHDLPFILKSMMVRNVHPPLYRFFLHYWVRLFGAGELSVRLPSAIWGILTLPVAYKIALRIYNSKVALVGSLLLAVNPFHILYSQQVREYSMVTFFLSSAVLFLLKALDENRRTDWAGYVVCMLVAVYSHYGAWFLMPAIGLYLVFDRSASLPRKKEIIASHLIIAVLFLPGVWLIANTRYYQTVSKLQHFLNMKVSYFTKARRSLMIGINSFSQILLGDLRFEGIGWYYLKVFIKYFLSGYLFFLFLRRRKKTREYLPLMFILIPVSCEILISFLSVSFYAARHELYVTVFSSIFISAEIFYLKDSRIQKFLLLSLCLIMLFAYSRIHRRQLEDWRSAVGYLNDHVQKGDIIGMSGPWVVNHFKCYSKIKTEYFSIPEEFSFIRKRKSLVYDKRDIESAKDLIRLKLSSKRRFWLIQKGFGKKVVWWPVIKKWIDRTFPKIEDKIFRGDQMDIRITCYATPNYSG